MGTTHRLTTVLFAGLALLGAGELHAQDEGAAIDVGTRSARLAQRVMSPFCPGKTLYDCPSGSATEMRLEMAAWMEDGLAEDEVVRRLEAQMPGFDFTPPPATSGLFYVSWIFATLFLVLAIMRLVRRRPASDGPKANEADDEEEYDRRLDEALQREAR